MIGIEAQPATTKEKAKSDDDPNGDNYVSHIPEFEMLSFRWESLDLTPLTQWRW